MRSTSTGPDGSYSVSNSVHGRSTTSTAYDAAGTQLGAMTYGYDPHGRQNQTTDARTGTTVTTFDIADRTVSVTSPDPDGAGPLAAQTSSVLYDSMDRPYETTQPDGTKVYQTYYPTGEVKRTWGSQTYPVEYTYDEHGRMKTLVTWQDFAGDARKATTTWNYDAQRGFLTSKVYTDASNAVYEYFPNGQLKKRTSVRGVSATYSYTDDGRLAGIDYSDATPDVSFQYDRRGRLTQVTDGIGTHAMTWTDDGQLLTEGLTTGELAGWDVAYGYDDKLRRTSLLLEHDATTEHQNLYTYEPDSSRLHTVSDGANVVTYSYLPDSGLVDSISYRNDQDTEVLRQQAVFDNLNRLVSTTWTTRPDTVEAQVVSSHTYVLNDLNQRTKATLEDGSYWIYDYDAKGQLIAGKHYLANDSPIAGQQFEYDYDDIGNRTAVRTGGDAEGDNLRTHTYAADLLNLYQQRAGAIDTADILGTAPVDTAVQVNGQAADRQGERFHAEVQADTTAASRLEPVVVAAVRPAAGPNGEDLVATDQGAVFLPQAPEIYLYDADGNLVRDSRWTYTWDAEDRLIEMVEHSDIVGQSARLRLVFAYDYRARRRAKSVYEWDANTESWTLTRHTAFVYDGWNLLAELEPLDLTATPLVLDVANRHTWGLDLSGTLQGAGGIGGLIITTPAQIPCFPAYDGNGNVVSLVNITTGILSATYCYEPFGIVLGQYGAIAKSNSIQFSSKYQDSETLFGYFGYRFLESRFGRWLNRDPMRERGGLNLAVYARNNPISNVDPLGLEDTLSDLIGKAALGEKLSINDFTHVKLTPNESRMIIQKYGRVSYDASLITMVFWGPTECSHVAHYTTWYDYKQDSERWFSQGYSLDFAKKKWPELNTDQERFERLADYHNQKWARLLLIHELDKRLSQIIRASSANANISMLLFDLLPLGGFATAPARLVAKRVAMAGYEASALSRAAASGIELSSSEGIISVRQAGTWTIIETTGRKAQVAYLTKKVAGLTAEQAEAILERAARGENAVVFLGSRVRGNFTAESDLDIGFTALKAGKVKRVLSDIEEASPGGLRLEQTRIVPGNKPPNIPEEIQSPQEFAMRSGSRSSTDANPGATFEPSPSITATPDGKLILIPVP